MSEGRKGFVVVLWKGFPFSLFGQMGVFVLWFVMEVIVLECVFVGVGEFSE